MIKLRRLNFMKFVSLSVILSLFMQIFLPLIPIVKMKISAEETPESYPVSYVETEVMEPAVETNPIPESPETPSHYLEGKKETFKNIVIGAKYIYSLNNEVKIIFKSLPAGENYFTIEEVNLTLDGKVTRGFDFNTNMENGSFEYSLSLPNAYGENAVIQYSEDGSNFEKLDKYMPKEDSISLDADHFTVFVVTSFEEAQTTPVIDGYNGIWFSYGSGAQVERVANGTDGISSTSGNFYGRFLTGNAFTRWDGYKSIFPTGGYDTNVDVYLDMNLAQAGVDKRFDFSSAINNTTNTHRRDFIFHLGTNPIQAGQWVASASNNAPGWPSNPALNPVFIDQSGWYTLNHEFRDVSGVLVVKMNLYRKSDNALVGSWVRSDASDVIGSTVGGNRYGWFISGSPGFSSLAIDNATIEYNTVPQVNLVTPPTPVVNSYVRGTITGRAQATDDNGMGSYYLRFWKNGFDVAGGGTLVGNCQEAPGADLLGTSLDKSCSYDSTTNTDGLYVFSAQFLDSNTQWGQALSSFYVDNTKPTLTVKPSPDTIGSSGVYKKISFKLYDNYLIDKVVINGVTTDMTNNQWSDANDIIPGNYWGAVEGQNTITLYDVAGNSSSHDFILDTTAPQISFAGFRDQLNGSYDAGQPIKVCGSYNKSGFIAWEWNLLTTEANPVTYSYLITQGPVAVGYSATTTNTHYNGGIPQEGYYEVEVWATDVAGNSSQRVQCSVTYDKTAPSVPTIIFPNESDAFNAIPILNDWTDSTDGVSGIENYRVEYAYDDGHSFSGGPYRYATLSQRNHIPNTTEEGGVKFRVQAIDKAGNEGGWSDWRHYYYDITVPSSSFENPLDDQYLNSAIDLSGSTFDNTGVKEVYFEYSVAGANLWNSIVTLNNSLNNSPFSWNYSWTPTLNGVYDIRVRAKDIAGNIESTDYVYNLTFDTNAPSVPLNGTPDNQVIPTNSFNFYWDESSDNLTQAHNIRYIFQSSLNPSQVGGVLTTNLWTSPTLMDPMIVSAGAPDGKWYWQVRAIDETGNMSDWSEIWDVTLDTTAPAKPTGLEYFDPSTSSVLSCGVSIQPKSIWPQWNANSESDFSHYEYTSFDVANNPQGWSIGLNEQVMTGTQFAHTWIPPVDGVYGYAIRSVDQVGNKSDWSLGGTKTLEDSCEYTVDGTAPVAPQLVNPPDNSFVKGNSITQSWTASDSDTQFYIYESYNDSLATSLRWHEQFTSTSKTATNVGDAIYWWRVKAVDEVGNESPWSNLWKITVDNTKPVTMIDESLEGGYFNSDIEIFGTTTDNYGVEEVYLYYKLKEAEDIESNWVYLATIENVAQDLPFNWTYIWSHSLDDGEYTIRANAVDLAGNIESTDYSNITIDKTAPTLELQELVEKIEGVNMPELQEFIAENPEELEISCTPSLSELSTLVDEDTDIEVTCSVTDKAGNKTTKTTTLRLTNNSPQVTISASPSVVSTSNITLTANLEGGDAPFTYSWSCTSGESSSAQTLVLSSIGTRSCSVTVTDTDGDSTTANGAYTINAVQLTQQTNQNNSNQNATGGSVLGEDALAQSSAINESDPRVLGVTTQTCDSKSNVSGYIYSDSNKNNTRDSSEEGIENVKINIVTISKNEEGVDQVIEIATVYTNIEGKWEATLCPGEYIAMPDSNTLPEGGSLLDSTLSLTVENDKDLTNQNFAVAGVSVDTNSTNTADINWWVIILIILAIVGVTGGVYYFSKRNPA